MTEANPELDAWPVFEAAKLERNWLVWQRIKRPDDGKILKVPTNTQRDRLGADAAATLTHEEASAIRDELGLDGIGYLPREGSALVGIDLDDCIEPNGLLRQAFAPIIGGTDIYLEVSPSGTGLRGLVPRTADTPFLMSEKKVVDGYSVGYYGKPSRFMAITGDHHSGDFIYDDGIVGRLLDVLQIDGSNVVDHPVNLKGPFSRLSATQQAQELPKLLEVHDGVSRDSWRDGIWAIASVQHPNGKQIALEWSKKAWPYAWTEAQDFDFETVWKTYDPTKQQGITIGTLIHHAKGFGYVMPDPVEEPYPDLPDEFIQIADAMFPQPKPEPPKEVILPTKMATVADILAKKLEPTRWLIGDLIKHNGFFGIVGRPKAGKGRILLQLLEAVGAGIPFFGRETTQTPFVYLAPEDGQEEVEERLQAMDFNPTAIGVFDYTSHSGVEDALAWLDALLEANPDIGLVVIDTLRYFVGKRDANEGKNAQDDDFEYLKPFRELCKKHNVALGYSMHERKHPTGRKPSDMDISDATAGSLLVTGTNETTMRLLVTNDLDTKRYGQLQLQGRSIKNSATIHIETEADSGRWVRQSNESRGMVESLKNRRGKSCSVQMTEIMLEVGAAGVPWVELQARLSVKGIALDTIRQAKNRMMSSHLIRETDGVLYPDANLLRHKP